MRHKKMLTLKVLVWQQCKEGEMGYVSLSRSCGWRKCLGIDCQEWPSHGPVIHIFYKVSLDLSPLVIYSCAYTHFFSTFMEFVSPDFVEYSKNKEATVPALLEESQWPQPKAPRAHLLIFTDMDDSSCHTLLDPPSQKILAQSSLSLSWAINHSAKVREGQGSSLVWSSRSATASSAMASRAAGFPVCPGSKSRGMGLEGFGLLKNTIKREVDRRPQGYREGFYKKEVDCSWSVKEVVS